MSDTPAPGHSRAGSAAPGRQSNGVRTDNHSSVGTASDDLNAYDPELVTSPGHGAVGVFQAPAPVRPRGGPADDPTLDIDSPFLDLFAGTPAPTSAVPASSGRTSSVDDEDFDFGYAFEEHPTTPAPGSVDAPPV